MNKQPKKYTDNPEYMRLKEEALEVSNDPIARVNYAHGKGSRQAYLLFFLLEQTQHALSTSTNEHLAVGKDNLEYLYRALIDAVNHMQEGLPEGVFDYILGNIESLSESLLEEANII